MQGNRLKAESLLFQWNFFERAISNYSIIIRMFQHMEAEQDLYVHMPRAFVEETIFDMCQLVKRDEGDGGFFCIDGSLTSIDCETLEKAKGTIFSPTVLRYAFGYDTLYVYPLKRSIHVFGYIVLGKKKFINLEEATLRDLELLCEVLNRFLLLNMHMNELKMTEDVRVRQLDSRLATTKTLLENIIDQFPYALFLIDRNGTICFANRSARDEFLDGKKALVGESIENVVLGLEKAFLRKDFILQGEMHYRKGDKYKLYSLESHPIKDQSDKIVFKSIVLKDIIDEKVQEEENANRSRMESIGKLAGGVAHDFNNVLTGILGYASLMRRMTPEEGPLNKYAEVIENSAKRASSLTGHLLNFSRRQRTKTVDNVDLNALLDDVLFLVRESFRDIGVVKEFEAGALSIRGDAGELQHAFLNLCVNAKDAMPQGGTLTIKTEKKCYIGGRDFAVVTIKDTGFGIDEALRIKIFEPFFTTKSENKKLGMGLYLVQKAVRDHGGYIEMESTKETGTLFTLYFPVATAEHEKPPKISVLPAGDLIKKRILVVDDEEVVRELLTGVLSGEGFDVLQAKDGPDGLAIFEPEAESIHLVILDMIMPGMKGEEVLRRIRQISASVKVIVSSGYMSEEQRDKLQECGVDAFLDKPYVEADAVNMVKRVLSTPRVPQAE